jgi:hypothetical protein
MTVVPESLTFYPFIFSDRKPNDDSAHKKIKIKRSNIKLIKN